MIGDNQLDYRFFIEFKLLVNEQEVSLKNLRKSDKNTLTTFLREVNHKLMDDFVVMPQDEICRFIKMADLIGHVYDKSGTVFQDYKYPFS